MSTLGEVLSRLEDRSEVYRLLAESGDVMLIPKLDEAVRSTDDDPCEFALRAVREFSEKADDEAWVTLIGRMQNAQAPAAACLNEMIAWSLKR